MSWFLYDNGLRHEEVKFLDTDFLIPNLKFWEDADNSKP